MYINIYNISFFIIVYILNIITYHIVYISYSECFYKYYNFSNIVFVKSSANVIWYFNTFRPSLDHL